MSQHRVFSVVALLVALAVVAPRAAVAGFVTINLDSPINGTAPAGTLKATFADVGTDTVQLTMDATGLTGAGQYVPTWLFNLNPSWNFVTSPLTFNYVSGIRATAVTSGAGVSNGGSQIKAGLFDVDFSFQTSNSGTPPQTRLQAGTTSVYDVTASGLTASKFAAVSSSDDGNPGGYYSAADVRAIPPSGLSGSIGGLVVATVPEPSSLVLQSLAFTGLFLAQISRRFWARLRAC